jgi:hypothetical protein
MAGLVYFGTGDKQSWIKAPSSGMRANTQGWAVDNQLLNGRAFIKRSAASHRRFEASWTGSYNSNEEASLQNILNYAIGLYGDGPYYFVDPFAANQNVMPPHWAAPMLTVTDWPSLAKGLAVSFTTSTANNGFPMKYASYTTTDLYESANKLTLIIPTGYKLAFGWHGPATGSTTGVRIVPYLRSSGLADTAVNPTKITAGGTVRTNTTISGTTYSKVEIFLATTTASTLNIIAMMAQIIPTASSVASGGFIAGKGTTGLEFLQTPTLEYMSSAINSGQIGMAATWVEV